MKRSILFALSATATLSLGPIAQAQVVSEGSHTGIFEERDDNLTEGIISPNSTSPNNRAIPGTGALEYDSDGMMETNVYDDEPAQTEGIISPTPQSPNNRQIPGEGAIDDDSMTEPGVFLEDDGEVDADEGIISPDPNSPVNRQVPGEGPIE